LLADAGHMLSDAVALALSLCAMWIAKRPPTAMRSYGYYRAEILAALVNGATLIAISILIFIQAYRRFFEAPEVMGEWMVAIAFGGLIINGVGLWILNAGRSESLNVQGAWLHVLADALGSIGAIIAGLLIWAFEWHWADPVASVAIGLLVIYSSWELVKQSTFVLMEYAPPDINPDVVRQAMIEAPGVRDVHDLHVWSVSSGLVSLAGHVVVEHDRPPDIVLSELRTRLRNRFRIAHSTLQIEPPSFAERKMVF
jgi:cobalt-zinc-cadmium efflux system protein